MSVGDSPLFLLKLINQYREIPVKTNKKLYIKLLFSKKTYKKYEITQNDEEKKDKIFSVVKL